MRRLAIAVTVSVTAVVVAGSGQAQASPVPRPVQSVQAHLVPGRGVQITEVARATYSGMKGSFIVKTTGSLGFGRAGNVDYDLVSRSQVPPEAGKLFSEKDLERLRSPLHAIKVGRHTYVSGLRPDRMSEGEDWLRFGDEVLWGAKGQRGSQVLDILDPAVLRKLIARSVSPRPGEYRGAITTDELYGEGTWGVRKVSYRLFVDADQLPVRLVTESSEKVTLALEEGTKGVRRTEHAVVDTHYRGWGAKTTITAPSRSENVTAESLMTQLYLPLSPVPIGPGGPVGDGRPR